MGLPVYELDGEALVDVRDSLFIATFDIPSAKRSTPPVFKACTQRVAEHALGQNVYC